MLGTVLGNQKTGPVPTINYFNGQTTTARERPGTSVLLSPSAVLIITLLKPNRKVSQCMVWEFSHHYTFRYNELTTN